MADKIIKYNPSFLKDEELLETFVVRHASLDLILGVIRDNTHGANQHLVVIGPRGSGKTTLLRRVAVAIRRTPELNALWFPLAFGEESYEVTSAGEFWLEAIHYLGVETGDAGWSRAYDELLREPDEKRLGLRCLSLLQDFADGCGKRLLLIVENLNLMLGEQVSDQDAWSLRETLMHESRLMLLGSAASRFDAIADQNKAMYELFRLIELSPLSTEECCTVWNRVAEQDITLDQARPVQILTGGNPRLLTILALFGARRSFRSLLEDLSLLVDEHTDYFKSNFETLPPAERKVFACLATLWEDSLAGDVARAARMTTSQVSALLKRLESRGAVRAVRGRGGKKRYQLTERLYNIYYLMRRGQDGGRVRAVVHFMLQYYGLERLHEAAADIAGEACRLEEGQRQDHYRALQLLCRRPEARGMLERIRAELPPAFLRLPDIPDDLRRVAGPGDFHLSPELEVIYAEIAKALTEERWADAVTTLRKAVELDPGNALAWVRLGDVLADKLGRPEEGAACLRKAVELEPENALAWGRLGDVLADKLGRPEEGEACLRKAVELEPEYALAWGILGDVLADKLGQPEEGEACLRKAVDLDPENAWAWGILGDVLANKLGRPEEGEVCLRKAVELEPEYAWAWGILGDVLADQLGRPEEGEACVRKAVELEPEYAWAWGILGAVLADQLGRPEEAAACLRKAVELDPERFWAWGSLGDVLANKLGRPEEGQACLRKAVELEPENALAWGRLGDVLANQLGQSEEGAACLRKAVELEPEYAWTWVSLGVVLADQRGQSEEAVACYRKVVELEPELSWAWVALGVALADKLGQTEGGAACLRKAVELEPENAAAWGFLGFVLLFDLGKHEEGMDCLGRAAALDSSVLNNFYFSKKIQTGAVPNETIEAILERTGRPASLLNGIAYAFMEGECYTNLEAIESWAREAVEKGGAEPHPHGTLARALALRGNIPEALTHAAMVLEHPEIVREDIQECTNILAIAAALGHGQEALDLLLASPSLDVLEPVAAGLKQYLGLDVHAPQEVKEIGDDIVKRIEYWKGWHANSAKA